MKKWKRKKTELILDEKYFKVRKDLVELPSGQDKELVYLDKTESPSVLVIGITRDKKIVMNRQFRYLVGEFVFELPAGYSEKGESIETAARREFEEETGYVAGEMIELGSVYETYGEVKHKIHVFFARELKETKQHTDPEEDIKVILVDFDKAAEMAARNEIPDAVSTLAIFWLKELISRGKIKI